MFKPGDRVWYPWDHSKRGTVEGPAPYRHNDSGREDLIVCWDSAGHTGRPLRQEVESYTIEPIPLIDQIAELDA